MKLVIISDIHGNHDALRALPEEYDELWVLGDLVNYGPQPKEVVADVMEKASLVVQGNHDHAVAYDDDSRWSPRYRPMAEATRRYTSAVLSDGHKAYLRGLPLQAQAERDGLLFHLTHAMPTDPLYGRHPTEAEGWAAELNTLSADVLLVGHTRAIPSQDWRQGGAEPRKPWAIPDRYPARKLCSLPGRPVRTQILSVPG